MKLSGTWNARSRLNHPTPLFRASFKGYLAAAMELSRPRFVSTRGALAHMYVQGELYTQAVSEIRAVLANDPQRIDMQVLLAKAYYHMGQKADASDSCSQLLKRYLYCLDANRILVEILPGTERAELTQVYRQRVTELEPYTAFAKDSVFNSDQVADSAVSLEQLEYKGQAVDIGTNWGSSLGIGLPTEATAVSSSQPDWLKRVAIPPSSPDKELAPASQSQAQIPDFLRQAGWGELNGRFKKVNPALRMKPTKLVRRFKPICLIG